MDFLLCSLIFFGLHYFFHALFLRRLKKFYRDTFNLIDRPSPFTGYYLQKTDEYSIFMYEKKWHALADDQLMRFNVLKQMCLVTSIILFTLGFFFNLN
ncbi:MAG: hypothetical protein ACJAUP_003407 [Cellvibrionaceae bacterium]|jgi:hypothetical protein